MKNSLIIIIVLLTGLFIYFDINQPGQIENTLKFITYGIFINIFTTKVLLNSHDKELKRIAEERNLLQTLLLKKERISSQKLEKAIKREANKRKNKRKK